MQTQTGNTLLEYKKIAWMYVRDCTHSLQAVATRDEANGIAVQNASDRKK